MNEVRLFSNPEFGSVRTVEINGTTHFVAVDICKALGYADLQKAVRQHCRWVVKHTVPHPQNPNKQIEVNVIPEGDMYRLIMKSQLPSAERFEMWVCDEVLPTIRQTGIYAPKVDSYMIEDPIARAERWVEEQKEKRLLEEKNQYLEETVEEQRPKAEYFDALVDDNLLTNFRDTAKELGLSQTEFVGWLLDKEYVYKDSHGIIKPYEPHRKRGLFAMKDFMNPNSGFTGVRTYVTVKGKNTFRLLLQVP